MVIYADVLFLVNSVSAYILLYVIGKLITKSKIKKWRIIVASAEGGALAVIIFSLAINYALSLILRLLFSLIMVFTAFYEQKGRLLSRLAWLGALSGMLLAAMIMLTQLTGKTTRAVIRSGVIYLDMPQKIFLPLFALSYILVTICMKLFLKRRAKKLYTTEISLNDRKITVTALFDSGNQLIEPVTGKSVSILEWDMAKKLLDISCVYDELINQADKIKLWIVPYHGIEGRSGIIYAFLADKLEIHEIDLCVSNTFIGIYGGALSRNNEYNALLNSALI